MAVIAGLCGLLAAVVPLRARIRLEQASRTVDLAVDGPSFQDLAATSGVPFATLLGRLHQAGVPAAVVPEATLDDLAQAGDLRLLSGGDVLADRVLGRDPLPGTPVQRQDTYVLGAGAAVVGHLRDRLGAAHVKVIGGAVQLTVPYTAAKDLGIGFPPAYLAPYAAAGMHAVLALKNAASLSPDTVARWVREARSTVPVDGLYLADSAAPAGLAPALRVPLVVKEGPVQLGNVDKGGLRALDAAMGGNTLRLFDLLPYAPHRSGPSIDLTVQRAVQTRNIRVVQLYPITKGVAPADTVDTTVAAYRSLVRELTGKGYPPGRPAPMPPLPADPIPLAVMSAAVALVAAALALEWLAARHPAPWLAAAGAAGALLAITLPAFDRPTLALLATLAFGAWPVWRLAGTWRRPPRLLAPALTAVAWAIAGGLLISALLATRAYLLEWSLFHGVKVAYLLPPLVAVAGFLAVVGIDGATGLRAAIGAWLRRPEHALELAGFGLVLAAALLYVARSGNSDLASTIEVAMRSALQRSLPVRPRTKELLIGYPCLIWMVAAARRRLPGWYLLLSLGGSAAVASVLNSFATVNTPAVVSLMRSGLGLAGGLAVGLVLLPVADRFLAAWAQRFDVPAPEERQVG